MSLESDLFETFDTKLLLLTGAGASKPLGMPLMKEFEQLVNEKANKSESECLRKIWLVHDKETKGATLDLEALLALVERYGRFYDILFGDQEFGYFAHMDSQEKRERAELELKGLIQQGMSIPEAYLNRAYDQKEVFENLDTLLRNLVFEVYGSELDHHSLDGLYSPMFELLNKHFPQKLVPIFTTNYDVAIETYALRSDIKLETGFASTYTGNIWRPARFYQFQPVKDKQNIVLFKLHGSLAWHRKGDSIISTGLPIRDPSGYKSAVIYPTQTKEFPDEEPFRTMYNFLKGCFSVTRLVIVIGYSFRDPGIHRIMLDALEFNPNLFFILICGSDVERLQKFGQQNLRSHQIIPYYFDFASNGAPYLEELDRALAELPPTG